MLKATTSNNGLFGREIFHVGQENLKSGPNTPGQLRKTALAPDGLWVGQCQITARNLPSQWHHHENYDSIMYMLEGRIRVDWGLKGEKKFRNGSRRLCIFRTQGNSSCTDYRCTRRLSICICSNRQWRISYQCRWAPASHPPNNHTPLNHKVNKSPFINLLNSKEILNND